MTPEQAVDAISMTNVVDARGRVELLAILRAVQNATREECAQVCETEAEKLIFSGKASIARHCARTIRDLIEEPSL